MAGVSFPGDDVIFTAQNLHKARAFESASTTPRAFADSQVGRK